ncbi:hypothetical protein C8D87_103775 [Lentzea atacamensis]|uniref:Integral membrane protein n=1 Tax=Lentzea atacamensis TaxID=531938 RepID=A0ABX9EB91_9PSEU|nr:hypothetical protein [Lentzea atacamensis]RAS67436.1 hypothetical protein C8D87_103775 [Lentzea atacamensis]
MIAIITVVAAFPLGCFLRSRLAASVAYGLAYLWAFTFQTLYLLLDSLNGGADPAFTTGEFPFEYGAVTLGVLVVGFGLLNLGHWLRARRRATPTAHPA